MAKNVQGVLFLRNGSLYGTREAALTGIQSKKSLVGDGQFILARYGSGENVKTLVGVKYGSGATANDTLTIIDVEGGSADVQKLREEINAKLGNGVTSTNTATAQLAALSGSNADTSATTSVAGAKKYADQKISDAISSLDYSDSAVAGQYVSQVTQADGKIAVTRVALPDASTVSGESKVVIDVTQDKGQITATAANITGVKLAGYAEGTDADIAATDTLGQALGKLQAQINAMDKSADVVAGQVVTTVAEADGKVTETKANVKDLQLGGYAKDASASGAIASGDTINAALSKLENKAAAITIGNADHSINVKTGATGTDINVNIKSGEHVLAKDGNAGLYTNIALSSVTPSSTTVKEEYSLVGTDGSVLGTNIKIYKDSSIVSITYITDPADAHYQNLEYVYIDASGNTQTEHVDMSALVIEAEFESGVTANAAGVVHGVVDSTSEGFLTVGADGFKLAGVQTAINNAIDALDVTSDAAVAGQYVAAIKETNGIVAVKTRANVSEAVLNNYQLGSDSGAVASTDTINQAISKLENQIAGKVDALDATVSGETADHKVKVQVVQENGVLASVTVTGTNIASDDALAALSAKTVTEIASSNSSIAVSTAATADGTVKYDVITDADKIKMSGFSADATSALSGIAESDSIATAFEKANAVITENERVTASELTELNGRLDTIESGYVETVKVNNVALAETNNAVNVQISGSNATPSGTVNDPAIIVNTDANGAVTLGIGYIDCGTY